MSDFYQQRFTSRFKPRYTQRFGYDKELTPIQQQMKGTYIPEAKKEFDVGKMAWSALDFVFDLLQRGQYTTANVVQDIAEGKGIGDVVHGAWQGITGERKGDWTTTLFGGKDSGEEASFEGIWKDTPEWMKEDRTIPLLGMLTGPTNVQEIIGFIANVALDPLNLVTFGATKGAKYVAQEATEKIVKQNIAKLGFIDEFAKFAQKGAKADVLQDLALKSGDEAVKYLKKFASDADVGRLMNRVTKEAYEEVVKMTPDAFQKLMIDNLTETQGKLFERTVQKYTKAGKKSLKKTLDQLVEGGTQGLDDLVKEVGKKRVSKESLEGMYRELLGRADDLAIDKLTGEIKNPLKSLVDYSDELAKVGAPEFLGQYKKLGQRGVKFLGGEFFKGTRQPWLPSRMYSTFKKSLGKTKIAGKLSDVVWNMGAKFNHPIEQLKKVFGIRNPYQKMLNVKNIELKHEFDEVLDKDLLNIRNQIGDIDNSIKVAAADTIGQADFETKLLQKKKPGEIVSVDDILARDELIRGVTPENKEQVREVIEKVRKITDDFKELEKVEIAKDLGLSNMGERANYLPDKWDTAWHKSKEVRDIGTGTARFQLQKGITRPERVEHQKALLEWLLGVDDETARILVMDKGFSAFEMGLDEMLMHRAMAHSRFMHQAKMIETFREFGFKFDDIPQFAGKRGNTLKQALSQARDLPAGLTTIDHPGLDGYFFDKDVADILNRGVKMTATDEGLKGILKLANGATAWWKSMAVLSPGFHLRNGRTNSVINFLKNGPQAFNPMKNWDAFVGTMYALYGEDAIRKKLGNAIVDASLGKIKNGKTIKELADFAKKKGVITRVMEVFDADSMIDEFLGKQGGKLNQLNPFSAKDFKLFKVSRQIGNVVESQPRFLSMLMDIEAAAGFGEEATEAIMNGAVREAKKWFFDYADLSVVEKKIFKNIMPFYTWVRKNLAAQIQNVMTNRQMVSIIPKFEDMYSVDMDPGLMPDWMKEEGYYATEEGQEGKIRFRTMGLPFKDLNLLPIRFHVTDEGLPIPIFEPQTMFENFLSQSHPAIKSLVQLQGQGYDVFRKQDLKSHSIAPRAMRLLALDPDLLNTVDGFFRLIGFERGLDVDEQDGKMVINARVQKLLEDNFLLLKRLDQIGMGVAMLFPDLSVAMEQITGYKDRYDEAEKKLKYASFWLGISQTEMAEDRLELERMRKIYRRAEEMRKEQVTMTPGQTTRDYREEELTRYRKVGLY